MRRIDADIADDLLMIACAVDPETLDPDDLAAELAPAIARALELWRDGQAAAVGHDDARRAAHDRAIGRGPAAR